MAKIFNRAIKLGGEPRVVGTPAITVLEFDVDGQVRRAQGASVPTDADAGYAKGCIFIQTDGGVGTTIYHNEGTAASADFNAVTSGSSTAYDDIGDPDANSTVAFAGYTNTWTSTLDTGSVFTISNTDADLSGAHSLIATATA